MGLFSFRPYKLDSLNFAEKSALKAALEVAQMLDTQGQLKKSLNSALKGLEKGKMSKSELTTSIACLAASLTALSKTEDPDRSSLLAKKKVATVAMALALDKLKNLL